MKRAQIVLGLLAVAVIAVGSFLFFRSGAARATGLNSKSKTVSERLEQYGEIARARLKPHFITAKINYPPSRVVLVGLKDERILQVYATDPAGVWAFIRSYRIHAASGVAGPKLREGDYQVPEGIYPIESLNPNSLYHLSLRLGYPNRFDLDHAAREGRTNLGGDIMIHGDSMSIGCLAMGDEAAEDLFVLAADAGVSKMTVILAPVDFRTGRTIPKMDQMPPWTGGLYAEIKKRLAEMPLEKK